MHVSALQQLLATLRDRYPDLLIENCSGGGNRLEPSMLAFSDTAWMDDRSSSAPHVRHNLQGLSTIMPPSSLLSFVFGNEWEGEGDDNDLPNAFRSRMPGILGATWRTDELNDESRSGMRQEIGTYKALRDALPDRSAQLLTLQVDDDPCRRMGRAAGELGEHRERRHLRLRESRRRRDDHGPSPGARLGHALRRGLGGRRVDRGGQRRRADVVGPHHLQLAGFAGARPSAAPDGAVGGRGVIAPRAPTFSEAALFAGSTLPSWKKVCIMNS